MTFENLEERELSSAARTQRPEIEQGESMRLSVACCTCGVPRAAWRVRASSRTEASERARIAQQGGPRVEVTGTLCNGRALRLSYTRLVRLVREAVGSVLRGQASPAPRDEGGAAQRVEAQWAPRPAPPQERGERIAWDSD